MTTTQPASSTRTAPGTTPTMTGTGVGTSAPRPDGTLKVTGRFAYSSDLSLDTMLWGVTVRSPHPAATITSIDIGPALAIAGVATVLTHEDVPGSKLYGMKQADQPVLAVDEVRYQGQPIAIVAADHPETARRAAAAVVVGYDVQAPLTDPLVAMHEADRLVCPDGNIARHVKIRHGDVAVARAASDVIVEGTYEVGTQDPAFLGPESGLAVPDGSGGIDLYVASQWIHDDQRQVAASLGLPLEQVRVTLAGVGGAFGGREDISVHIHACMLALRTGRPVKMSYNREESFVGHVHRHPATMRIEQGATSAGRLTFTKAEIVFDGGAYTSTSKIVIANGSYFAAGAYAVDNVEIDGYAVYTNNPPCGAMRGFGAVQTCYAIESSMDRLAGALGMDPLELRLANAIGEGDLLPTGQPIDGPAPVREILHHLRTLPLPPALDADSADLRTLPGGVGNSTHGEGIQRGVGYALGMKAIGFSGGVDDYSTARVSVGVVGTAPLVEVYSAASEMGQGITTVMAQIARTELGIDEVVIAPADTGIGDAGSSSASRQTWMTGGAVKRACELVRDEILERAGKGHGGSAADYALAGGAIVDRDGSRVTTLAALLGNDTVEATHEYHHRPTEPIDDERGQGNAHIAFAYSAHRAVVDVDVELGLVRVVELATAQDVGNAINPLSVEGQIHGGTAHGLGLAVLEELQIENGVVKNPSFMDYLIPTILDMPPMDVKLFEFPHPDSPYGLNGVGEPPTLSSTPAIANALRDATGLPLPRVPVRPIDLIDTTPPHDSS